MGEDRFSAIFFGDIELAGCDGRTCLKQTLAVTTLSLAVVPA